MSAILMVKRRDFEGYIARREEKDKSKSQPDFVLYQKQVWSTWICFISKFDDIYLVVISFCFFATWFISQLSKPLQQLRFLFSKKYQNKVIQQLIFSSCHI
jgi:hypothetical protein